MNTKSATLLSLLGAKCNLNAITLKMISWQKDPQGESIHPPEKDKWHHQIHISIDVNIHSIIDTLAFD